MSVDTLDEVLNLVSLDLPVPCVGILPDDQCPAPATWIGVLDCHKRHGITVCDEHRMIVIGLKNFFDTNNDGTICIPCKREGVMSEITTITWRPL